jgi:hypothetical protein
LLLAQSRLHSLKTGWLLLTLDQSLHHKWAWLTCCKKSFQRGRDARSLPFFMGAQRLSVTPSGTVSGPGHPKTFACFIYFCLMCIVIFLAGTASGPVSGPPPPHSAFQKGRKPRGILMTPVQPQDHLMLPDSASTCRRRWCAFAEYIRSICG